jgi:hypothetical protein
MSYSFGLKKIMGMATLTIALLIGCGKSMQSVTSASMPKLDPINASVWQHLWIGGGGYIDGLSTPPGTGVRFARTDAGGAYVWSSGKWQQLITSASLAATDFGVNGYGLKIDEIAGCNNSSACAYLYYGGYVFFSSNINTSSPSGITFCRDNGNLAQQSADSNNLFNTRGEGATLAVDPNNSDHVILGTTVNGLYETFNGTSCNPTWSAIAKALVPLSGTVGYRIAFDPTSTLTCHIGSGICSKNGYIWTSGATAGVYATANAGTSWALTSGGPSAVGRMKISYATAGGGNVWVTDGNGAIWRYASGSWLKMVTPGNCCSSIAIDPNNGNHVVGLAGSISIWISLNATAASPTFSAYSTTMLGGDAPWQAASYIINGASSSDIDFDPNNSGVMFAAAGQGLWTSPLPLSGTSLTWLSQVNGIEELLLTGRAEVASEGNVTFGAQDQGSCHLSVPYNLTSNAADCGPLSDLGFLQYASGLSVTPDGSTMFAKVSQDFNGSFDFSGTSTDGFAKDYKPLNLWIATVPHASLSNNGSNVIRAMVSSTSGLTTWANGSGSILCAISADLTYKSSLPTRCFGATVVNAGNVDLQGSVWSYGVGTHSTTLFEPATALISWAGTGTISNITNNAGTVRVTTMGALVYNGFLVCISGVTMTGLTTVNGCWVVQNSSGNSFDLGPTSHFVAGDTYVTGGEAKTWGAPGGGIAAASTTNWTMYGGNGTFPMCTNNGGATYSEVDAPSGMYSLTTVTGGPYLSGANSFTVASGSQVTGYNIFVRLASGRLISNSGYSVAGNTVTLNGEVVPPGDRIIAGAAVSNSTGWPYAAYFNTKLIAADQVTPNTFYAVNTDYGLLKWTHCNSPTLVTNTGQNGGFLQWTFHGLLRAVPGEAGHLFYTAGPQGSGTAASGTGLWRTCNGVNSAPGSVTLSRVPGFFAPQSVGFGHAAPGKGYPAIIVVGWYSIDNNINDAVYGIWRSIDDGSHGSTSSCSGGTWQNLSAGSGPFLQGWSVVPIWDAIGDPYVYGPIYVAGLIGAWFGDFQ